jgi:hypothetical protein
VHRPTVPRRKNRTIPNTLPSNAPVPGEAWPWGDRSGWPSLFGLHHAGVDRGQSPITRDESSTALFSESSEPSFDEFPFAQFKELFPDGDYTFAGETIDGQKLQSTFALSHAVPEGPTITSPEEDAAVAPDPLVVRWLPDDSPAPVDVAMYEVLVVDDAVGVPNPQRSFDVMQPGDATSVSVPSQFLAPGSYKIEVLAIDRTGNQTLSEVPFTVA